MFTLLTQKVQKNITGLLSASSNNMTHQLNMTQVSVSTSVLKVNMPNRLQCLDVPVLADVDCENAYPGMISSRMLCAGFMDGGRDACNVS